MRALTKAGVFAGLLISIPVTAAGAAQAATHYTHSTTLTHDCSIYENYPKSSVPTRAWTKPRLSSSGAAYHVGVRYTYKGYAMVMDYAKSTAPTWGFIAQSCLTDPYAYSQGDHGSRLPDLQAMGGNGQVKAVPISAPHSGKSENDLIHLGSNGSLRSGPQSFVIGNARDGDPFWITTTTCGHHSSTAWILGYAPNSGRWGYIEAMHLPACG